MAAIVLGALCVVSGVTAWVLRSARRTRATGWTNAAGLVALVGLAAALGAWASGWTGAAGTGVIVFSLVLGLNVLVIVNAVRGEPAEEGGDGGSVRGG